MIRVLLADDDDLVRAGLRMILEAADGISVVAEAATGAEAVAAVGPHSPDVILMDVQMPDMDGIEATRRLTSEADDGPRIIMLTTFELDRYVFESLRAGASGFLLKRTPPEQLIEGIRVVAAGDALLSPSVTSRLIEEFGTLTGVDVDAEQKLSLLTDREREVLVHVAHGLTNAEIARELFISESTAKTHLRRVLMKLDLRDRVSAVVFAYEAGVVKPGSHDETATVPD